MAAETARALGCEAEEVLVASTGVIGVALDPHKVGDGIIAAADALDRTSDMAAATARAIMTTDPFPKSYAVRVEHQGQAVSRRRHRQGLRHDRADAGDDARLPDDATRRSRRRCCSARCAMRAMTTFNAITVDGECSTNDSVFVLANGASGVVIDERQLRRASSRALRAVCRELALGIVRGGEGATKLVTVHVTGARTVRRRARRAARAIANSLLVKTAIHGGDPNWGRLLAVAGPRRRRLLAGRRARD